MLSRVNFKNRRQVQAQSGGFTLLEIIVAIAVLSVIILPLTMAMVGVFTNSTDARGFLDRNNDAQRIASAWTADVQSVLPGGVNPEGTECLPTALGTAPESALITFAWTSTTDSVATSSTSTTATANPTSEVDMVASWVSVGTGTQTSLWRRECANGTMVRAQRLAANIGNAGQQGIDVVHGPAKTSANPSPHTPRSFCPYEIVGSGANPQLVGKSCTIVIDGSWKYDLQVARRVPDVTDADALRQAPPAPRNLTGTPRNQSILARFESPIMQPGQPPLDRYRVRATPVNGGAPVDVLVGPGPENEPMLVTVDQLSNSTEYMLTVQAHNAVGWGDWTGEVGPLQPLATEPNAPTIVSVTAGDKQASIRFTPPANDGGSPILAWHVYAQRSDGSWLGNSGGVVTPTRYSTVGGAAPSVTAASGDFVAIFTDLENGTAYHFYVGGVNAIHQNSSAPNPPLVIQPGEGILSDRSPAVTPYGPPETPTGVQASGQNPGTTGGEATAQIRVRWAPPTSANGTTITGYRLFTYVGQNATTPVSTTGELLTKEDVGCPQSQTTDVCAMIKTITVSATQPSNYYRFALKTVGTAVDNTVIEGDLSPLSTTYGTPRIPPAIVDHVRPSRAPDTVTFAPTITTSGGNVTVSFTPPYNGGEPIESVRLTYESKGTAPGSSYGAPSSVVRTPTGTSPMTATFPYSSPGTVLRVKVEAGNRGEWTTAAAYRYGGASGFSNELTFAGAPAAPTNVTVQRPGTSFGMELDVAWTASANLGGNPSVTYSVTCTDSAGYTAPSATGIVGTSVRMTGLRDGRVNTCRVAAVAAAGTSGTAQGSATSWGECQMRPSEDTFVNDDSRNTNYGSNTQVELNPSTERQTLLKFPIAGGSASCVNFPENTFPTTAQFLNGVTLRLWKNSNSGTACCFGTVYSNTQVYRQTLTWTEGGATWNNTRGVDWSGGKISDVVRITDSNDYYTWNINNGVLASLKSTGNTFLIARENGDNYNRMRQMYFEAKEGSSVNHRPLLSFTFYNQAP